MLTGSFQWLSPPADLSGVDRLYGGSEQAVKTLPIPPKKDGDWQILQATSTGQAPGAAEMVTLRTGTCWVSPCRHVIRREALVSKQGARMQGCIRLTVLPESSTAGNGRPLILTSAPGAPTDRSQCTIQPANHVRLGGVRPSVGMGSSLGVGAAGRSTGRRVPSGASLLLDHPPGKQRCSLPSIPVLGSIRQLHSLDEFSNGGGVPHPDHLAVGPWESTEESVDDDDALRYPGHRGLAVQ